MNEHQLSKRLAEVAALVPTGTRLADIGTDHAYLPVHLAIQGKISMAIAGELNEGPLQTAKNKVDQLGLTSVIEVRQGDGLDVLETGEVDVIVVAGMGGALIVQILAKSPEKLSDIQRLIVQPNVASHLLRQWFIVHGWQLKAERMIEEDGKSYEILMAEPGDPDAPYEGMTAEEEERAIMMGPFLLKEQSPVFIKKWLHEIDKRQKIVSALRHSEGEEKEDKLKWTLEEMHMIEEGIDNER